MFHLLLPLLALPLSWAIAYAVCRWSVRGALMDVPNERSSHKVPTPRGGGLGIVVVTLLGSLLTLTLYPTQWPIVLAYTVGGGLIAAVSWVDDLRTLPNSIRFGTHALGAILVILTAGTVGSVALPGVGALGLGILAFPVTLIWIAGLTNAYNFMDGIDGIAGGQAVVAGVGWFLLGFWITDPAIATLVQATGLSIAVGSVGFLFHNWPPAKIFMGDVGSAFLGFSFAFLPILAARDNALFFVAGVLLVWPFLFDTAFTIVRRLQKRENVFAAHRSHLYQRLVIAGYPHRTITLLYIVLAAIGLAVALSLHQPFALAGILLLFILAFALWRFTLRVEAERRRL